ncbi:MAG: hypothetical protein Q8807_03140, partial ['Waltheria sp.' little leaf phytoplasma]|nr:hypothetical protein ['Waltheria sp.' little leaf phytoplasma]
WKFSNPSTLMATLERSATGATGSVTSNASNPVPVVDSGSILKKRKVFESAYLNEDPITAIAQKVFPGGSIGNYSRDDIVKV